MKSTFKLLIFSKPYFILIVLNTLFNLLAVIFSLFSISLIIPILGLLFGTIEPSNEITNDLSFNNLKDYIYNVIYDLIKLYGLTYALGFICILVGLGTMLKNSFRYCALYCLTPFRNNIIRDVREKMYTKLLKLQIPFVNKFKKGDLVARMTNDLIEVEWSIMGVLEFFIKDPIHIIIFLISLIYINVEITLIGLVCLPIAAFLITKVSKSLKQNSKLSQIKLADIISFIEESITNLKIIKAFNSAFFISTKFNSHNERLKNLNNKVLWRKDLASPMSEMLSTIVMIIIIWFGGKTVLNNNLDAETFIGYLIIFSQILPPAKSLTTAFYSIQKGAASAERIMNILEHPIDNTQSLKFIDCFKTISFDNVSFKSSEGIILKNVNLNIEKGQKIAIVGESGSGKSTLLELLLKFYPHSSGSIKIDEEHLLNLNCNKLFGLVTQDVLLFNDTILNNILLGNPSVSETEVHRASIKAHIHKFIQKLDNGYNTIIGAGGINLSGGERQRISLARAFISQAPILILDEPTSALDAESHQYIQSSLKEIPQSTTLITITHKLSSIVEYDHIIVMDNGSITDAGNHTFLIKNSVVYKKLYEIETFKKDG